MRERLTQSVNLTVAPWMYERLQAAADEFSITKAEVIRGCIEGDIDKFVERLRKRNAQREAWRAQQ